MSNSNFDKLLDTIVKLRDPKTGCPWDIKQTPKTLGPSLLEECCECIDGIANNDTENIKEELGDIIFTSTLLSYIIEQEENGSVKEIIDGVNNKMILRHPHVFGDVQGVDSSEKVLEQWEDIKQNKEGRVKKGTLDKIPDSLPPLEKSNEIQKKVGKVGFDWPEIDGVFGKIEEEISEVKDEIKKDNRDALELEIGDLLFSVVNLARYLKIDPSIALARTNKKFENRFGYVEYKMKEKNLKLSKENFRIMDSLWDESKKEL